MRITPLQRCSLIRSTNALIGSFATRTWITDPISEFTNTTGTLSAPASPRNFNPMKQGAFMKKISKILAAAVFLFISSGLVPAPAVAEPASIGQFSFLEGRVDRKSAGRQEYLPVLKGEPVYTGDTLRTKGYSRAEMTFNDQSI